MLRKKCKFGTVFARVMKHARHTLFIIAIVVFFFFLFFFFLFFFYFILRAQNNSCGYIKDYADTKGKNVYSWMGKPLEVLTNI